MATDYANKVAEVLIEQLKQGLAPFQKPWQPGQQVMPFNPTTGKDYRGGNSLWLMAQGYGDPRWLTFKQANAQDARVRRGEHGTQIQYLITSGVETMKDAAGQTIRGADGTPLTQSVRYERPRLTTFTVFNAEQIDGLEPLKNLTIPEWQRHERAESILNRSGANISHISGNQAYYQPSTDRIVLPERGQFSTADGYYGVALHELGHWTGAAHRLNRDLSHPFGSEGYAREELRAEIASMMVNTSIGVGHDPNRHAGYVKSWIKALENDPTEIFRAAADAEKISALVRGFEQSIEQPLNQTNEASTGQDVVEGLNPAGPANEATRGAVATPTFVRENDITMQSEQHDTAGERTYLVVPYADKDKVKAFGARWDRDAKSWYMAAGADLTSVSAWLPERAAVHVERVVDPRVEFGEAIRALGLRLDGLPEMDGKIHKVAVDGDKGKRLSGAYAGHLDGHPGGYIKNFRANEQVNWKSSVPVQTLSPQDKARLATEAAEKREARAIERSRTADAAALVAKEVWGASVPAPSTHPYLERKGIGPGELRVGAPGQTMPTTDKAGKPVNVSLEGRLLVPMRDIDGKLWALQTIDKDGTKMFQKGGRVEGSHTLIGTLEQGQPLVIAEGYATAETIHKASGATVAVAFNAGNLAQVAAAYREADETRLLVIAGDNDHQRSRELGPDGRPKKNVGAETAREVAEAVLGVTLLPEFKTDERGSDWNDYAQLNGIDKAAETLRSGLRAADARALAAEIRREEEGSQQVQAAHHVGEHGHEITVKRHEAEENLQFASSTQELGR